jgi:hypothetical protein
MTDINNSDEAAAIQRWKDYWGTCPHCHDCSGQLNVGRSHWFFCDEHKVRWCVGSNLFSAWRFQTEEEQRAIYDAKDFGSYRDVEPYFPPPTDAEREEAAKLEPLFAAADDELPF